MLPKLVYQLLPYFYIALSLLCMLLVDSSLVFYPSILLIAAAVLVFWLRYRNSVDPVEYIKADNPLNDDGLEEIMNETSNLPEHERRFGDEREFPLVDDNDVIIPFDRRTKKKPD